MTSWGSLRSTALLVCCITNGAFGQNVVNVSALPDWKVRYDDDIPTVVVAAGTTATWELSPRGLGAGDVPPLPEYRGALVPVVAGNPITVTATVERGFPVIMITAGPIHPLNRMFQGEGTEDEALPGEPIAYAIASSNTATLSVTPEHDAVWQLWVWVLSEEFEPDDFGEELDELSDEYLRPWLEAGLTREQVRTLMNPPHILQAWQR